MKLDRPTDRLDYVPITGRPPRPLPGGARVVVWPCVNVENWVPHSSSARVPAVGNTKGGRSRPLF